MKTIFFLLMLCFTVAFAGAQNTSSQKGNKAYILVDNNEKDAQKAIEEFNQQVKDWGYWSPVEDKSEADVILNLNLQTKRGMTMTSYGGVTVRASVAVEDKSGTKLWKSKEYKASPTPTNGYNSAGKVVRKIMDEMKKEFK